MIVSVFLLFSGFNLKNEKKLNHIILRIYEKIVFLRAKLIGRVRRYIPSSIKAEMIRKRNYKLLKEFPYDFQVIEFSFIDIEYPLQPTLAVVESNI